jgi:hypothetical protein
VGQSARQFGGTPAPIAQKANAHDAAQNRSNKRDEQTNIKQINTVAQRERHYLLALLAQMSQHSCKTEVRAKCGLLFNVNHEQKSEQITMTTIGYARVSTDGLSLQSQTEALHLAGCGRVYSEKISGAYSDRPQLAKAIAALGQGDTLVVCKLDRLARSTRDLLNTLDAIGKAGATFKSLGDPWADTTTPHGRLMLTVLGGLAEFERHLILSRTAEGRTGGASQWREVWEKANPYNVPAGRRPTQTR